ncbi:hypothetical protein ES332_A03G118000v1 [Gossypium tomentosum]|uniref:Uncharacterized protein n=1 Tax=Gossypium tomentosum TaxID=34277 RepID=A0A5D2R662_GOSTO|nr:hypothetical protein ES332_A03G118000v1 [Gossypium tomentosum]
MSYRFHFCKTFSDSSFIQANIALLRWVLAKLWHKALFFSSCSLLVHIFNNFMLEILCLSLFLYFLFFFWVWVNSIDSGFCMCFCNLYL